MAVQYYEGIGRRKESTARVRLMRGSGKILVNGKPLEVYLPRVADKKKALAPLRLTNENLSQLAIVVSVK